jgi:hypothetical protein
MRALLLRAIFATATLVASVAFPQMHKVAKPQQVVRAVGVYEWIGDFAKPAASRLIPVSLYIEGKFEDAGVYIARPVPFALLSGNVYILQAAGIDKGTLDLAYAKHLQAVESTGDLAFDDGWFGYGSVKPLSAPRKTTTALKASKTLPVLTTSTDPNRPHFGSKPGDPASSSGSDQTNPAPTQTTPQSTSKPDTTASSTTTTSTSADPDRPTMKRRSADPSSSGTSSGTSTTPSSTPTDTSSKPADDPDRPTMKRRTPDTTSSGSDTTSTASTTPDGSTSADDPDRPTMKRRSADTTPSGTASTTDNTPPSADDPDRPTLKRHTAEDSKKTKSSAGDVATVTSAGSLNEDPNRPNLHHGKPTSSMTEADLPKLTGLPPNLHQMVAVSDAVNRDPHPFTLEWDDEAQHKAILDKMQTMASAQLAAYGTKPATPTQTPTPAVRKTTPATARSRRSAATPAPQAPLLDEDLKAYTLSYGGAPTYIYSANTGGTGAALRYVTIVAQTDGLGDIKPAIQSVTDATHFNRTPKMQFVDVVDADASNRASLLFELRSQNARQFALYRVIASHPEQIFLTGTTQ